MKNLVLLVLLFFTLFSCQKEDIDSQMEYDESITTDNLKINGLTHVDEETNCDGYYSIYPSGDNNTGRFQINATLKLYTGNNQDPYPYNCNYIKFTGNYNKSEKRLYNIKSHYYKSPIRLGELEYKYNIDKTDITWHQTGNNNTFRFVFNMDKMIKRSQNPGAENSHYPDIGNNNNQNSNNDDYDYGENTEYPGDFITDHILSDGKSIDIIVQ